MIFAEIGADLSTTCNREIRTYSVGEGENEYVALNMNRYNKSANSCFSLIFTHVDKNLVAFIELVICFPCKLEDVLFNTYFHVLVS